MFDRKRLVCNVSFIRRMNIVKTKNFVIAVAVRLYKVVAGRMGVNNADKQVRACARAHSNKRLLCANFENHRVSSSSSGCGKGVGHATVVVFRRAGCVHARVSIFFHVFFLRLANSFVNDSTTRRGDGDVRRHKLVEEKL